MHERHARLVRALVSAAVSTLATACAHVLGGGHAPHPVVMVLVFAMAVPLCLVFGGRRVTLATLAAAVGAAQALQHAAFTFIAPQVTVGALSAGLGTTSSGAHAHHLDPGALQQAAEPAAQAGAAALPVTHMLGTHALAGVATLAMLRAGTQALQRMAAALALATGDAVRAGRRAAGAISAATAAAAGAVVALVARGFLAVALLAGAAGGPATARWARRTATGSTPAQLRSRLLEAAIALRGPPPLSSPRFHPAA